MHVGSWRDRTRIRLYEPLYDCPQFHVLPNDPHAIRWSHRHVSHDLFDISWRLLSGRGTPKRPTSDPTSPNQLRCETVSGDIRVSIRPYAEGDLWILKRTLGDPSQMTYLDGPESEEKILNRDRKYLAMSADPHAGCSFTVLAGPDNAPAGNIGYWESEWKGQKGWEMGWLVLPEFQGRGIGTAAARLVIQLVTELRSRNFILAFPSVDNQASNAICRKVGFTLTEEVRDEYPPGSGHFQQANVWKLALPVTRD
jgi:RimJ/RimL family protein N-acetyltransferase